MRHELAIGVADVAHDRAPAPGEIRAGGQAGLVLRGVAAIRLTPGAVDLDTVELALELEIHHPRQRVRAVHRGRAAGDDLDAFDQRRRDDVEIGDAVAIRRHQPLAIHQHQCRRRAKSSQADVGLSAVTRIVRCAGERRHELRQRVERRLHGPRATALEEFFSDRDDRAGRVEVRPRDARAGDDHLLEVVVLGGHFPADEAKCGD